MTKPKLDEGRAPPRTPKWERPETFEEMSKLIGELLGDESAARVDDRLLAAIEWYADTRVMAAEAAAEARGHERGIKEWRDIADKYTLKGDAELVMRVAAQKALRACADYIASTWSYTDYLKAKECLGLAERALTSGASAPEPP